MKSNRQEYQRRWREEHREQQNAYKRQWYLDNKVKHQEQGRKWREANKEHKKIKDREYYELNKFKWQERWKNNAEEINQARRISRVKNREKHNATVRKYRCSHSAKHVDEVRQWRKRNPEKFLAQGRKRRATPQGRLRHNLSTRIWHALDRRIWSIKTMTLLGCSLDNFLIYLESKFESGMTFENYGSVWHIDHIMPCAIFDLTKPEHQRRCFHFSNLQPMFGKENLKKGAKLTTNQYNLL